jgi:hypothetical protein
VASKGGEMSDARTSKRKPANERKSVRYSLYTTPVTEARILKHEAKIIERYGSINEWLNVMINAYLSKLDG